MDRSVEDDNTHIAVHADCEFNGIKSVAYIGIYVKDVASITIEEVFESLDKEVDAYIACRVKAGHWKDQKTI